MEARPGRTEETQCTVEIQCMEEPQFMEVVRPECTMPEKLPRTKTTVGRPIMETNRYGEEV